MLRLIVQNGKGRGNGRADTISTGFRTFEIECPEFEAMLAKSYDSDEAIVTLLGIEIFTPAPKFVQVPAPALPITAPTPPTPEMQAMILADLKAKHKPTLMQRLLNGNSKPKVINLPG